MRQLNNPILKLALLALLVVLVLGALGSGASAQDQTAEGEATFSAGASAQPAAVDVKMAVFDEPVELSFDPMELVAAEEAYRETLQMPETKGSRAPIVGPESGTDTVITRDSLTLPGAPTADGSFSVFRKRRIWAAGSSASNVSEVSVLMEGRYGFATGNWWAAQSWNGGYTWSYVNPYAGLTKFCCDQIVMYDKARNLWLWLRMTGLSNNIGSRNRYRISASTNNGSSWTHYDFWSPSGEHLDYPHWSLSNDFLYLTTNKFHWTAGTWTGARLMKMSLDNFRDKASVGWSFFDDTCCGTIVPTQGATETMYWAGHASLSSLRIFRNSEDSGSIGWNTVTIPAWTNTGRGSAYCGNSSNWGGRADHRPLAGWVSRGVIGFMWNVQEGGGFTYPYVNAATFNESDRSYIGRPYVWSSAACWLYPSVSVNSRGHIGVVLHGGAKPNLHALIDDDFNGAPPGWEAKWINSSTALPSDDKWGDYNTSRPSSPTDVTWIGGGHTIRQSTCCNAAIWYFAFGRQRDAKSYWSWVFR